LHSIQRDHGWNHCVAEISARTHSGERHVSDGRNATRARLHHRVRSVIRTAVLRCGSWPKRRWILKLHSLGGARGCLAVLARMALEAARTPTEETMTTSASSDRVTILIIMRDERDRYALKRILDRSNWVCRYVGTFEDGVLELERMTYGVIVTKRLSTTQCWTNLLEMTRHLPTPPYLVVAERFANPSAWAEVFSLGAYEVLIEPFEPSEVFEVLRTAWLSWSRAHTATPCRGPARSIMTGGASTAMARQGSTS
jgi:hypothetical protein